MLDQRYFILGETPARFASQPRPRLDTRSHPTLFSTTTLIPICIKDWLTKRIKEWPFGIPWTITNIKCKNHNTIKISFGLRFNTELELFVLWNNTTLKAARVIRITFQYHILKFEIKKTTLNEFVYTSNVSIGQETKTWEEVLWKKRLHALYNNKIFKCCIDKSTVLFFIVQQEMF